MRIAVEELVNADRLMREEGVGGVIRMIRKGVVGEGSVCLQLTPFKYPSAVENIVLERKGKGTGLEHF